MNKIGARKLYANACHRGNFGLMDSKIIEKAKAKHKKEYEDLGIDINSCRGGQNKKDITNDLPHYRRSKAINEYELVKYKMKHGKDRQCKKGSNVKVRTYLKNLLNDELDYID